MNARGVNEFQKSRGSGQPWSQTSWIRNEKVDEESQGSKANHALGCLTLRYG